MNKLRLPLPCFRLPAVGLYLTDGVDVWLSERKVIHACSKCYDTPIDEPENIGRGRGQRFLFHSGKIYTVLGMNYSFHPNQSGLDLSVPDLKISLETVKYMCMTIYHPVTRAIGSYRHRHGQVSGISLLLADLMTLVADYEGDLAFLEVYKQGCGTTTIRS